MLTVYCVWRVPISLVWRGFVVDSEGEGHIVANLIRNCWSRHAIVDKYVAYNAQCLRILSVSLGYECGAREDSGCEGVLV